MRERAVARTAGLALLLLGLGGPASAEQDSLERASARARELEDVNRALLDRLEAAERRLSALEGAAPTALPATVARTPAVSATGSVPGQHSVYGDVRLSVNRTNLNTGSAATDSETLSQDNNASVLGFKGHWGDDWRAFYSIQAGLMADGAGNSPLFTRRYAYAGIANDRFGEVRYGTMSTPYKSAGVDVDPFYNTSAGASFSSENFGLSPETAGFIDNALLYRTPSFAGFTVTAAAFLDDGESDDHGSNLQLDYRFAQGNVGISFLDGTTSTGTSGTTARDVQYTRLFGSYALSEELEVGLSFEHANHDGGGANITYTYLSSRYALSQRVSLVGAFGRENGLAGDGFGFTVAAFYDLFPNTSIYSLFSHVDRERDSLTNPTRDVFSLGVSHKFGWGL